MLLLLLSLLLLSLRLLSTTLAISPVEPSTKIKLPSSLNDLPLLSTGVRRKGPIKVYAIGLYSEPSSTKTIRLSTGGTGTRTFLLETNLSLSASKMSSTLISSLKTRFVGSSSKLQELSGAIIAGCNGAAPKSTTMQFECIHDAIGVAVNGKKVGVIKSKGIGAAFTDIYTDEKAVTNLLENLK